MLSVIIFDVCSHVLTTIGMDGNLCHLNMI